MPELSALSNKARTRTHAVHCGSAPLISTPCLLLTTLSFCTYFGLALAPCPLHLYRTFCTCTLPGDLCRTADLLRSTSRQSQKLWLSTWWPFSLSSCVPGCGDVSIYPASLGGDTKRTPQQCSGQWDESGNPGWGSQWHSLESRSGRKK